MLDKYKHRFKNACLTYSDSDVKEILTHYLSQGQIYNDKHNIFPRADPETYLTSKPISDHYAIQLWNTIYLNPNQVDKVEDIKLAAKDYLDYANKNFPNGDGMTEADNIRYITAMSSSSFLGIQGPSSSTYALDKMKYTLSSHCEPKDVNYDDIMEHTEFIEKFIETNPQYMEVGYDDICLSAKHSSASHRDYKRYNDYVMSNTLEDVISNFECDRVPYNFYVGTGSDRRGGYGLIFSNPPDFRILDYIVNHGSYGLCEGNGILSQYTTEGYNNMQIWHELIQMTDRNGYFMACLDYKSYDSQLLLSLYLEISKMLNKHGMHNSEFFRMFSMFEKWMKQPKPLLTLGLKEDNVLLECVVTLASGLHGTHSFENIVGVASIGHAMSKGINIKRFWANGDDQNALVVNSDQDKFIQHMNKWNISWDKSILGHKLSVWGKLWFSRDLHPMWEIGTFRSIWEKEGGEIDLVEPSKLKNNYCKIIQVAITLIGLGLPDHDILGWILKLCDESEPKIDPYRIPRNMERLNVSNPSSVKYKGNLRGLESVRAELESRDFHLNLLGSPNYYQLLKSSYQNGVYYTLNVEDVEYWPTYKVLSIQSSVNYSEDEYHDIPWLYRNMVNPSYFSEEQLFVRSVLQGTKSYDGPVLSEFYFDDMLSLAKAINNRNRFVWRNLR